MRAAGHDVLVVDQYDGHAFDDYDEADEFLQQLGGYPALMQSAGAAVAELADGFLAVGFSNGGGVAEYVATQRAVAGVVMCSGALPVQLLGAEAWPTAVPAQIHCSVDDPRRHEGWAESVAVSVASAGGRVESFAYPGRGHLFTDPSLPAEYDPAATALLWERVLSFCAQHGPSV